MLFEIVDSTYKGSVTLKEIIIRHPTNGMPIIKIMPVEVKIDTRYVDNVYDFTLSYRLKKEKK